MATLIRSDSTVEIPEQLPVIALRDLVFFPYMVLPLLIGRPRSLAAMEEAEDRDSLLLVVAQKDAQVEEPTEEDLHRTGTVVRLVQITPLPDGTCRVVMEGLGRARIQKFLPSEYSFTADVELHTDRETAPQREGDDPNLDALVRGVRRMYDEYVHLNDRLPPEIGGTVAEATDLARMAHLMAGHLLVPVLEKQELLESPTLERNFEILREILVRELEILRIEDKLDRQIQSQVDTDRRQHYLQEQLKAIHKELGSGDDEWSELEEEVEAARLPRHARERVDRELVRLKRMNPVAPEAAVIRTYVEWILALPWSKRTEDHLDVSRAAEVLDRAHFGLDEVKDRILDHIAVLSLVGELRGPILCLVGPPGVGKTSLGRSIAESLGRDFVRASLGGVRDEAEIRGHRRTYVGALPGRIVQGIRRGGSRNPVFLLDEVDKLARDFHGDPGAALLEVLDPEQNATFTDHYLEIEFDLSEVLFIATANTLAGIPEPLRDRMEVIRIPGYLDTEKCAIAKRFLWPRQLELHGLPEGSVVLGDAALDAIIDLYTREAGVRELERRISRVVRKVARRASEGAHTAEQVAGEGDEATVEPVRIDADDLKEFLGPPAYTPPSRGDERDRTGIANGLAWTAAGGEILDVEVAVVPGTGKIQLTGTLGDVMKESAFAAVTYARSRAGRFGLDSQFHKKFDIHIHIPEGATPKDGPSAGITIAVALISALTDRPTRGDVAMTGEITLRGRVLGVGGVKEKAVAALRGGIRMVILPKANMPELEILPQEVREGVEFDPVETMDEVLDAALAPARAATDREAAPEVHESSPDPGIQLSQ